MPFFFIYLLKLSVSLTVVFLFYQFVLRKLTFYNWNRWYLLGYTALAFLVPFINISSVLEKNEWVNSPVVQWIPVISDSSSSITQKTSPGFFTIGNIALLILLSGMLLLLSRLLIQFISFRRMKAKAELISGDRMKIYQVQEDIIPFSFGNSIFINQQLHSPSELQEIIRHEFVHVKQAHSIDIIWGELLCLFNWYNPFAWLLKKSIRQNLEFIADNKVLAKGTNKKEYQYLLLKVIGNHQYSIATQFNFSSLKKRIAMMNKLKSTRLHLVKFLFLLPVAVVMLLAFRTKYEKGQQQLPVNFREVRDTILPPPAPPKAPVAMKLPENVEKINANNGSVTVWLKNGNKENYNLHDVQQKMEFDKKYGKLPEPPPPPVMPKGVKDISRNGQNIVTVTMENGKTEKFDLNKDSEKNRFEKNYGQMPEPPVMPVAPRILMGDESMSRISNDFEITDKKAVIHLKDGTTEKYDLTDKKEKSRFEEKYGKLININTNVNTNVNTDINTNFDVSVAPVVASGNSSYSASTQPVTVIGVKASGSNVARAQTGESFGVSSIAPVSVKGYGTSAATPRAAVAGVGVIDDYGYTITGKEDILITITNSTTKDQLEEYKRQMKEKGVDLSFDEMEYEKGILVKITGTMKSGDSQSNFVAIDFRKLILAMIKKENRIYFKVSVTDKNEVI